MAAYACEQGGVAAAQKRERRGRLDLASKQRWHMRPTTNRGEAGGGGGEGDRGFGEGGESSVGFEAEGPGPGEV
jgi:hypothetical protein